MDTRLRLTIDLSKSQYEFLNLLPHGWKQKIFATLIDKVMERVASCETNVESRAFLGLLAAGKLNLEALYGSSINITEVDLSTDI